MSPHEPDDNEGAPGSEEHLWWLNVINEEYESLMMHKTYNVIPILLELIRSTKYPLIC